MKNQPSNLASLERTARSQRSLSVCMPTGSAKEPGGSSQKNDIKVAGGGAVASWRDEDAGNCGSAPAAW
ncbi:hypothetical protein GCM10023082_59210 [Streptomyces tremellae]|uniref:Uncharacterized protein n=1 Tax=Streptomyces tremellae TaxID=1124239 RepID=A0ABP7G4N4_9ACTN